METIASIRRLYYVNGKGYKTIARELRLSKNTVKKVIREDKTQIVYQRNFQAHRALEGSIKNLIEKLNFDITVKKLYQGVRTVKDAYFK